MPKRADADRLERAATTLANASRKFLDTAAFLNAADDRAFRAHGGNVVLDLKERIGWIERALDDVRKVVENTERKAGAAIRR